ncbi:MAG: site-2 protease family protein, partial [Candidatus Saccharimonadales bacterium]
QKWGSFKVAIAGPLSNISLAVLFGLLVRLAAPLFAVSPSALLIFSFIVQINLMLAIFNLIPVPPLDGSWILMRFIPDTMQSVKMFLYQYGIFILIFLVFFGALQGIYLLVQYLFTLLTGF